MIGRGTGVGEGVGGEGRGRGGGKGRGREREWVERSACSPRMRESHRQLPGPAARLRLPQPTGVGASEGGNLRRLREEGEEGTRRGKGERVGGGGGCRLRMKASRERWHDGKLWLPPP